jgi:hypothetical protein
MADLSLATRDTVYALDADASSNNLYTIAKVVHRKPHSVVRWC